MGRKTFRSEQIIFKLREVEVLVNQGASIACFILAIGAGSFYSNHAPMRPPAPKCLTFACPDMPYKRIAKVTPGG